MARANEGLPVRAPPGGDQRVGRPSPGEEAGEMKRKRPAPPRVRPNRDAVWELLEDLGMSKNELTRRCGLSSGYLSLLMADKRSPSPRTQRGVSRCLG